MSKTNDILSSDFLDFEIFGLSDENILQIEKDQSNQSKSLVVYHADNGEDGLQDFLTNILTAVKLDTSKDVSIVKVTDKTGISFIRAKTITTIEKMIIFGIAPNQLGINLDIRKYVPLDFQGCTFLYADTLSEVKNDVNKKKALWASLQEIYLK